MTAAECLEHKWLKEPDTKPPPTISSPVPSASPLVPRCHIPSVSDSPSGQRRALASTLTDDDDSDDVSSLREPAKKCRCDVDLKKQPVDQLVDQPRADSSEDKENCVDVEQQRLSTTSPKLDCAETSPHCGSPTTVGVAKTLVAGVCIDISVA